MRKRTPEIEVRVADMSDGRRQWKQFDEVVAENAHVHLEKMTDQEFALIVETKNERACFLIHSKNYKAHVDARTFWQESKADEKRKGRK